MPSVNLIFQSKGPTLHLAHDVISDLYRRLLQYSCIAEVIIQFKIHEINPADPLVHLPVDQIYLGEEVHKLFQRPEYSNLDMIHDIKTRCRKFLIVACQQIQKRFDLNDQLWKLASYLHPKLVIDATVRSQLNAFTE